MSASLANRSRLSLAAAVAACLAVIVTPATANRPVVNGSVTFTANQDPSLVAHFPFEGTADDSSEYENDGVPSGGPSYTAGVVGQAVCFDGVDDFIRVPDNWTLETDEAMTLALWIKPYAASQGSKIISKWWSGPWPGCENCGEGDWLLDFSADAGLLFEVANYPVLPGVTPAVKAPVRANRWTHAAMTFDHGSLLLYVNGLPADRVTTPFTNLSRSEYSTDDIYIGQLWNHRTSYNYAGCVDEVRLYNRALGWAEIAALADVTLQTRYLPVVLSTR